MTNSQQALEAGLTLQRRGWTIQRAGWVVIGAWLLASASERSARAR